MEKFYLEEPCINRKKDAIDFINEFYEHKSDINGTGGLQRFLDNYEGWLEKLENDYSRTPDEVRVPARTYFLIRSNDNKIVGMINIRLALNEHLRKFGGNIGYCIRPTERGNGCNKINLYLGLKICQKYGIKEVLLDADKDNPASWKTMEALGGINIREYFDDENSHCIVKDYKINVDESIEKYSSEYEDKIEHITFRNYKDNDYDFVYKVKKNAYKEYVIKYWNEWNEEIQRNYFDKFINNEKENSYIIQYDNIDIGFYNGNILENGNYEIGNICIIPEYQNKGIGTRILENLLALYKNTDIELQCFKINPVKKLYERLGFNVYEETEFHYKMKKVREGV